MGAPSLLDKTNDASAAWELTVPLPIIAALLQHQA
jgi:hypothetical protein